ncbi:gustatory and odorant receptor 22-like isoform X1 [Anastrepha obliqua]|uniref:gustatory and odorant receptor 22-like isoform X1 n=2 Tax=Anastrepha obliqua TaxID=95512 RepID=UPI002409E610|nr:gustatory and odorant receptor 22-like isoform X1 [Anastrepha obliqua]
MKDTNLLISDTKLQRNAKFVKNAFIDSASISRAKHFSFDSIDYEDVERHDQFYRDHKLLLILFRVLAVMPILRSSPGCMTFSWKSPATIYAFIFWIFMTIVVLIVGKERIQILYTTKQFDEYIYAVIFVIYLIPHFWIPFVGWGVAAEVAEYKSSWGTFQLIFYRVTGTSLQFPRLKSTIVVVSIGCLLCAFLFLFALSFFLEGYPLWHTLAYYHIIITINMNCALWYINSRAIKTASTSLTACFKKEVLSSYSANVISKYRMLWLNLSELLQSLGNAYARTYSTYCIFMFVNIVIAVYGAFAEIFDHTESPTDSYKEIGLIVDGLYCSTLLFIFCDCSHNATLGVAKGIQKVLLEIDVRQIDRKAKSEIDIFIFAIEMNPAIVSLKGYVNVNRELLTSFISTVTVYLLVLIQFKFTLN